MSTVGVNAGAPPNPGSRGVRACPFVGLVPFVEDDEDYFFGRERERDLIGANLAAGRLTILYGRSGVGKTSVIRAAVLPEAGRESQEMLDDLGRPGFITAYTRQWAIDAGAAITQAVREAAERTPGAHPIAADLAANWAADWTTDQVLEWFGSVITSTGCAGIRLILDQFEEYFTYNRVEPESGGLVDALAALVRDEKLPVHVLLSLREESLASLDRFKGRIPNLFANRLSLQPLTQRAARDAVLKPVARYNEQVDPDAQMSVEPGLLDVLVDEVQLDRIDPAGGKPVGVRSPDGRDAIEAAYLQLVLTKLWSEERDSGSAVLHLSTLEALGGAESIVRRHLDEVMGQLSDQDQDLAATIFHHLVTRTGTKLALSVADLTDWAPGQDAPIQRLLDWLGGQRRVVRKVPPPAGVIGPDKYEIYHDVLALAVADWRRRHDASRREEQVRREREEALAQAEQERQDAVAQARAARRRLRRTRLVAVGLGVLVVAIGALLFWAKHLERQVGEQETLRVALLEAEQKLDVDPTQSLRVAVAADDARTPETNEAVLRASGAPRYEMVTDPAWCPDEERCGADRVLVTPNGARLVVLDTSGDALRLSTRTVADPATGRWVTAGLPVEALQVSSVIDAAVSDDATLIGILTLTEGFVVDAGTGEATKLDLDQALKHSIAFLGRGDPTRLAVSTGQGIGIFDAASGRRLNDLDVAGIPWPTAVVGQWVVGLDNGDRKLKVWGADAPEPLFASEPIPDDVRTDQVALAAAPGMVVVATGAMNQPMTLLVWRWEDGPGLGRYVGSGMKILSDVSIDAKARFATVAADKTARQFDLKKLKWRPALPQHSDWVFAALTVRNGKRVLTAGADGRTHYWSTKAPSWAASGAGHPVYELLGHDGAVVDLIPVGTSERDFVSVGADRTARVWGLPETRRYEQHKDWVIGLEVSTGERCQTPSAKVGDECLVTVSSDRAALHHLEVVSSKVPGEPDQVDYKTLGVLKAPEGRALRQELLRTGAGRLQGIVLYENEGSPRPPELWEWDGDGSDARLVTRFEGLPADVSQTSSLSLSKDGSFVMAGDEWGRIHTWTEDSDGRWNIDTSESLTSKFGGKPELSFAPTGAWLALTTEAGVLLMNWDADADSAPDPTDLRCPEDADCARGALNTVFSADGRLMAVSNLRGDIHVWSTADGRHLRGPLPLPGLSMSRPALSADGRLLAAGTDDGLIQVWDVESGRVIFRIRRHADSVNAVAFAARPGESVESLLVSVSDDTTAAVIPCPPCADAAAAVAEAHEWIANHPGPGSSGRPAD